MRTGSAVDDFGAQLADASSPLPATASLNPRIGADQSLYPKLADGVHTLVASETDGSGNASTASLTFTLKTWAPAPSTPTLSPASDSGVAGDGITNVTTPVLTGTGEAGDTLTLLDGTTAVGSATVDGNGAWSLTTSALKLGSHALSATETDIAGNASTASSGLSLTIVPPTSR